MQSRKWNRTFKKAKRTYKKEAFQQALELFLSIYPDTSPKKEAELEEMIGQCYGELEDHLEAIRYYELVRSKISRNELKHAELLAEIGWHYKEASFPNKAISHFHQALEGPIQAGSELWIAIKIHLSDAFQQTEEFQEALDCLLELVQFEDQPFLVTWLNDVGAIYRILDDFEAALAYFQQALELAKRNDEKDRIPEILGNMGHLLQETGKSTEAYEAFQEGLSLITNESSLQTYATLLFGEALCHRDLYIGDLGKEKAEMALPLMEEAEVLHPYLAECLAFLANIYSHISQPENAKAMVQKAMDTAQSDNEKYGAINNLATLINAEGRFEETLALLEQIPIHEDSPIEEKMGFHCSYGKTYLFMGDWESAQFHYLEAEKALKKDAYLMRYAICEVYQNLATISWTLGKPEAAWAYLHQANKESDHSFSPIDIIGILLVESQFLTLEEKYGSALEKLQDALEISKKHGLERKISSIKHQIGLVLFEQNKLAEAKSYFVEARNKDAKQGYKLDWFSSSYNLAFVYALQKNYQACAQILEECLPALWELLDTSRFSRKKDLLALYIDLGELLIEAYNSLGNYEQALGLLFHFQKGKSYQGELGSFDLSTFQKELPEETVCIVFSNMNRNSSFRYIISKNDIVVVEMASKTILDDISSGIPNWEGGSSEFENRLQRFSEIQIDPTRTTVSELLYRLVMYYRDTCLKSHPLVWKYKRQSHQKIGQLFFEALLGDEIEPLSNYKNWLVVPDSTLHLLPIGSLVLPTGEYVAEKHTVFYSFDLSDVKPFDTTLSPQTKTLACYATYENNLPERSQLADSDDEKDFLAFYFKARTSLEKAETSQEFYHKFRPNSWLHLPGVKKEIEILEEKMAAIQVIPPSSFSKETILELSDLGKLSKYDLIHFACHSISLPILPELSAIVMNDGTSYLNTIEIGNLSLDAKLVCLSSCESGLNKVLLGLGMRGLAYAFLEAGCQTVFSTLWSVDDDYMPNIINLFYQKLIEEGKTPFEALAQTQLACIHGDLGENYSHPKHWASLMVYV